jgi:hypothetical protein
MPTFLSRKYDIDEISNSELELLTRPSAGQQVEMFSRAPSSRRINVYQLAEDDSGGKDEHLRKPGHFAAGSCNPFITRPSKLKIVLGKCWRICELFTQVLKPNSNTKVLRLWNKLFVISCFIGLFLDPLFFLTISISLENKCVVFHNRWAIAFTVFRSVTDFIFLLHMLLQVCFKHSNYCGFNLFCSLIARSLNSDSLQSSHTQRFMSVWFLNNYYSNIFMVLLIVYEW